MADKIKVPTENGVEEKEVFGYFRVLRGRHSEGGRVYERGSVVPSVTDLNKLNSPGAKKFEQIEKPANFDLDKHSVAAGSELPAGGAHIEGDKPNKEATDKSLASDTGRETLNSMTVADLRKMASEEEINLHGASTKDEIVEAIIKARNE